MDIKKLQGELVEKISLIPTEDDRASFERALEIVNQLGEGHINDTITIGNKDCTALDCVIIFDSQGNNQRLSERPRINNRALVELESAIRQVGGKTSEELGRVQNISYSQSEFQGILEAYLRIQETQENLGRLMTEFEGINRNSYIQMIKETACNLAHFALFAGSSYLIYTSRNDEEFSTRCLTGVIGMGVFAALKVVELKNLLSEPTRGEQERQVPMNLENVAAVQPNVGERQPT